MAPRILNLGTRWKLSPYFTRRSVQFHLFFEKKISPFSTFIF